MLCAAQNHLAISLPARNEVGSVISSVETAVMDTSATSSSSLECIARWEVPQLVHLQYARLWYMASESFLSLSLFTVVERSN
jgi:hypothetical protein